MDYRALVVIRC